MLRFKDLQEFFSNFKIFELFEEQSSKQNTLEEEKQGAFHCYAFCFIFTFNVKFSNSLLTL